MKRGEGIPAGGWGSQVYVIYHLGEETTCRTLSLSPPASQQEEYQKWTTVFQTCYKTAGSLFLCALSWAVCFYRYRLFFTVQFWIALKFCFHWRVWSAKKKNFLEQSWEFYNNSVCNVFTVKNDRYVFLVGNDKKDPPLKNNVQLSL